MKKRLFLVLAAVALTLTSSCQPGQILYAEDARVTFALVIHTLSYNGMMVIADVHDHDASGAMLETVQAAFESYPNTMSDAWAKLTTLEPLATSQRYHLDFFIDVNDNGTRDTGDMQGIMTFEVAPSAVWSEAKYFYEDLDTV